VSTIVTLYNGTLGVGQYYSIRPILFLGSRTAYNDVRSEINVAGHIHENPNTVTLVI